MDMNAKKASAKGLKGKLQEGWKRLSYLTGALELTWAATKGWTIAWAILLFVQGALPAANVYLTKSLVDGVAGVIGTGYSWQNVQPALIPALLIIVILLLSQVIGSVLNWIRTAQSELIQDHIKMKIYRQAASIDLEFFETPEYFDLLDRSLNQAEGRSLSILQNISGLLQNLTTLVAIAALLIPYSIWLPLVLLLSTLPALFVVVRHDRLRHTWWEETTEKRRWVHYYNLVLTIRYFAAELRIFNLNEHFHKEYETLRHWLREGQIRLVRNQSLATLGAGFMALCVTGATLAWMGWRAMQGAATLGDLALFYQAFNQGQGLLRTLLSSAGRLYTDALYMEHLFTFLALKPKVLDPEHPRPMPPMLEKGIDIEGVSFRYPGSEQLALRELTLFIPAGKTVAIVGPNGAGKSTLIKMLCRFYDPEAGRVRVDGINLRELAVHDLWRHITVLFQDYVNYAGTIADSIIAGDMFAERDQERLEEAAQVGGAMQVVEQFPQGFEAILGKQFKGGRDLSGGQYQRVALSRTLYRKAPIILLDEPTSYMDSWAEAQWVDRFWEFARGRTAVIVTHRFTTAKRADIIYVLQEGQVAEAGNHAELLVKDGLYAASWHAQIEAADKEIPERLEE